MTSFHFIFIYVNRIFFLFVNLPKLLCITHYKIPSRNLTGNFSFPYFYKKMVMTSYHWTKYWKAGLHFRGITPERQACFSWLKTPRISREFHLKSRPERQYHSPLGLLKHMSTLSSKITFVSVLCKWRLSADNIYLFGLRSLLKHILLKSQQIDQNTSNVF